ncbi:TraX protein [Hathewaya proteolytica DSM 3090]|uniref:TraX protein n=1 Tax=Hathewaya proteolytica DSM 3090 TaxID=1121331 RepID=A0A1M6N848_9CLOT|nr:TraX family protein [Hathewaya proteolytica]SHJ91908.1 TraX protein [Hathewaya proteolytica DSM 3090]
MSFFALKLFAVVTMFIDHIGAFLFPKIGILRTIGRLSFPIFAFCIANGYKHTKNKFVYMMRLAACGVISIIPYSYVHYGYDNIKWHNNIFFTLFLGLLCIFFFENAKKKRDGLNNLINICSAVMVFVCLSLGNYLDVEYGLLGVALVLLYHFGIESRLGIVLASIWGNLLMEIEFCMSYGRFPFSNLKKLSDVFDVYFYWNKISGFKYGIGQWFGMFAAIPLCFYNGKKGYSSKWVQYAFYLFYPVHLLLIGLIYRLIFI